MGGCPTPLSLYTQDRRLTAARY